MTVAVGILDSGVGEEMSPLVAAGRAFVLDRSGEVASSNDIGDLLGHGAEMARIIIEQAPGCRLIVARVFHHTFTSQPQTVAAGLDWLVDHGARLVNMSFGLGEDRAVLRHSVAHALSAGTILVASAPALGSAVYPASYDDVIAVTGDARCGPGEISDLGGDRADFGTYCGDPDQRKGRPVIAGASIGAAHFSGLAADLLDRQPDLDRQSATAHFRATAMFGEDPRRRRPGLR
ncbi:MAG: S8 family serine peptidase [Alphaproteobacteria bacterium]|nr:S8 family serine peptidase [Alphaproteobacteria bacterium]